MVEKNILEYKTLEAKFRKRINFFQSSSFFCDYSNLLNITPPRLHPSFLFFFLFSLFTFYPFNNLSNTSHVLNTQTDSTGNANTDPAFKELTVGQKA